MPTKVLQHLVRQGERLSPDEKLRLIAYVVDRGLATYALRKLGRMVLNLRCRPLSLAGRGRASVGVTRSACGLR
jgi:hypothetical protein